MHRGGYLRHKISSSIEERRARRRRADSDGREDGADSLASAAGASHSSSFTGDTARFSGLLRQTSEHDFLVVEEDNKPRSRSMGFRSPGNRQAARDFDEDEDDPTEGHHRLDQGAQNRQGSEEPISDLDLEKLDVPDEEEDLYPKSSSAPKEKEAKQKDKIWEVKNAGVYEQQLELLQDQLTSALIENQSLKRDSKELEQANSELTRLRRQNTTLSRRLSSASNSSSMDLEGQAPKLELASESSQRNGGTYRGNMLSSTDEDGFESVTVSPDVRVVQQREQQRAKKKSLFGSVVEWIYDFIADFTEEQSGEEKEQEEEALTAKKLKNNLQQLSMTSKPWTDFGLYLQSILQWRNTAETLVVFLIYMYCVWNGWVLSMLLFLAILALTLTYLKTSGLAEQFGLHWKSSSTRTSIGELGFGDKLQLVKHVAQTSQNKSKMVSDSLEKAQNLFLWHQPVATKTIYRNMCVFFIASLFLPNSYILTAVGLFLGVKLFIVDNIYRKYPKVKERYDGLAKIWKSLPTDAQLLERQALLEEQLNQENLQNLGLADSEGNAASHLSQEDLSFCTRFCVSQDELPLPSWKTGKRCSILDKDRPLSLRRSGRLYLTQTHLCFERSTKLQDPDRFIISLNNVLSVSKAKPFAVLPGSGMSVEVTLNSGTKHLFSAIINRDQAYCSILDQGLILGLPWGTEVGEREDSISSKSLQSEAKPDKDSVAAS